MVAYRAILDVRRELVGSVARLRVGRRVTLRRGNAGTTANAAVVIAQFGHGTIA